MKRIEALLGLARRAGKLISGMSNCLHGLSEQRVKLVIITTDAGCSRKKVIRACQEQSVPCLLLGSMDEFACMLGKHACIWGVLSEDMAIGMLREVSDSLVDKLESG
jgi:ribosomal protein L7Ae-like RNA K-turn-binding protein